MKRILIALLVLGIAIGAQAQTWPKTGATGSTGWKNLTFATADSMGASNTYNIDITADLGQYWYGYDIYVNLDSLRGNPAGTLRVYGKWTNVQAWTAIDSLTVGPLKQADTSIYFTKHSALYYNYLRLSFTTTAATQRSRYGAVNFKIWKP